MSCIGPSLSFSEGSGFAAGASGSSAKLASSIG